MGKTNITIDGSKCRKPQNCRRCQAVCGPAIIIVYSPEKDSNDPKEWRAEVVFTDLCTKCNACIAVCPTHAIKIR